MTPSTLNNDELHKNIDDFIKKLQKKKIDPLLIEKLQQAADNLDSPSAEWLSADILRIFNSALLLEQLRSSYRNKASFVGVLEIFRNVLVLAPILLTWTALSQASVAYQKTISSNPELIKIPFLLQWEEGFNGNLWFLFTFSHVALTDAVLLAIIIAFTFTVHLYQNSQLERHDREAIQLTSEYDNLLWRLNSVYSLQSKTSQANLHLAKQMKAVVEELKQRGDDFQNLLTAEQDRLEQLADMSQKQIQDMQPVITSFQVGSKDLATFSQTLQTSLVDLNTTASRLATGTQQSQQIQKELYNSFNALEGRMGSFELVTKDIAHTLLTNFTDLGLVKE